MFLDKIVERHLLDIKQVSKADADLYEQALRENFHSTEVLDIYFWLFQKGDHRKYSESLKYVYNNFWYLHELVLDIVGNIRSRWRET